MDEPDANSSLGTPSVGDELTNTIELPLALDASRIKHQKCELCGCTPLHESPLEDSTADDQWGGYIPWYRYTKACGPQGEAVKVPLARLCKICHSAFIKTGLGLQFGTVAKYMESQKKEGPEEHHKFMRARKRLIDLANQSDVPDRVLKKELIAQMTKAE